MPNNTVRKLRKMIRIIEREVERQLRSDVQCCGVSLVQCHTLLEIEEVQTAPLQFLAERLSLDKSTVSRTVDGLVLLGLIDRRTDPANRRSIILSLTKKGQNACRGIHEICDRFYSRLLEGISGDKTETVIEGVTLFASALRENRSSFGPECKGISCMDEEKNEH
jgi:DNA-binding MarR family transcriptional regulator